jgi:site-specific recombinase XerD
MHLTLVDGQTGDIWLLIEGWELHLRAANKSPKTIRSYVDTARLSFGEFLLSNAFPTDVADITIDAVAAYLADQLERFSENTAALRYRTLKVFFNWLVAEGEIEHSPMAKLSAPKVGEVEVPVIPIEDVRRLLSTCSSATFDDRRDAAMIRVFYDTGFRLSEMAGILVQDVDVANRVIHVTGKGNKGRPSRFGVKTAPAVNRYLRERAKHPHRDLPSWWIGSRGAMTSSGITQMLRRRSRQAGLHSIRPHQFRHTWAAEWLADGGQEGDLQRLGGWASREMLARYGRYTAAERALSAHDAHAPGDRL